MPLRLLYIWLLYFAFVNAIASTSTAQEQQEIITIKAVINLNDHDTITVNQFNRLAYLYASIDADSTHYYLEQARPLAQANNYTKGLAINYLYTARVLMQDAEYDEAIANMNTALQLFKEIDDLEYVLESYMALSYLYSHKNSLLSTLDCNNMALPVAVQLKDSVRISLIYNNIGSFYFKLNDFDNAYRYFQKSIAIDEANSVMRKDIILTYSNLGMLLVRHRKMDEARDVYLKIIDLLPDIKNEYYKASVSLSTASYYIANDEPAIAKVYIDIANDLSKSSLYRRLEVRVLNLYGDCSLATKDYETCLDYYDRSLDRQKALNIQDNLPEVHAKRAKALYQLGDLESAYKAMEQARVLREATDSKRVGFLLSEFEDHKYRLEQEQTRLNQEVENQKMEFLAHQMRSRYFLALLIIFFLVSSLIIVITNMKKMRRRGQMLEQQHVLISEQKRNLEQSVEKLNVKENKLKEYNATKDKFFSIIAHDLRSPMSSLIGFSELIVDKLNADDSKKALEYALVINDVAHNSLDLLNNLLEWATQQIGQMSFKPELTGVNELASGVVQYFKQVFPERNISFKSDIDDAFNATLDRKMMNSVLRNLISNALKYTENEGHITLNVMLEKDQLILQVSDEGIGMSSTQIDKLFKLAEAESTRGLRNEKGTGLGLMLCRDFVKKHQGRISVTSHQGEGSVFSVALPL